jgi:GH25 family lysozyme M1 (1,4-beta-N-acetylmuramidase)
MGITFSSFKIRGIDVSQFNGNIDWTKVTSNFAGIRVGYGKTLDTKFTTNWTNAKGKVNRLAYWYMDYYSNHNSGSSVNGMTDTDWGVLQAETCWANLKDDPEGIVFLDIENANPSFSPPITTVAARVQTIAKAFLERLDSLSTKVNGLYCSLGMLNWFGAWFKDRPLWVAWYNESQTIASVLKAVKTTGWTGKCYFWQYASDGDVDNNGTPDGIAMGMQYGDLDLNAWMGTQLEYTQFFTTGTTPPVEEKPLYKVKILIYNLTVRTGPGVLYSRLRRANFPGEYSIYEEKSGFGRISTTASEWISLSPDYVLKLSGDGSGNPDTPGQSTALYTVKILINNLSVRTGPGILYTWLRRANFPGEYGIFEEKKGYGRISKTASEWISLSTKYVSKVNAKSIPSDDDILMKLWAAHPELH